MVLEMIKSKMIIDMVEYTNAFVVAFFRPAAPPWVEKPVKQLMTEIRNPKTKGLIVPEKI